MAILCAVGDNLRRAARLAVRASRARWIAAADGVAGGVAPKPDRRAPDRDLPDAMSRCTRSSSRRWRPRQMSDQPCASCSSATAGWAGWSSSWRAKPAWTTLAAVDQRALADEFAGRRGDRLFDRRRRARNVGAGRSGINVVIGTTGWQDQEAEMRAAARRRHRRRGGAELFARRQPVLSRSPSGPAAARRTRVRRLDPRSASRAKKDAPSGTALTREEMVTRRATGGRSTSRPRAPASSRAPTPSGSTRPAETITLTHTARDRAAFARGALEAPRWVRDGRGGSRCATCSGCEFKQLTAAGWGLLAAAGCEEA